MKILHIITDLRTGGAEKLMVDILPRLRDLGNEVELLCLSGVETLFYRELQAKGIKIHSFGLGSFMYNPLHIVKLLRFLHRHQYDIIHTHNTAPQLFAAIVKVLCSVVLVTTEHTTSNRRRDLKWYRPIDIWMYRQYEKVICISDQAEENLRNYLGVHNCENVCTVYNGIDYHKYADAVADKGIRTLGEKIITNVAGFRYQKDQPTLIKAMKYLPESFHLCLVGDGERRSEFEALIKNLGLEKRVHLLGLRSDVPNILAASDYVVMCSHFEGLSLSSLEGMASGKPFLADNVDGLREIVNGNGVLFKHEDAEGLANAILQLERDKEYSKRIVQQCQAKAVQYDISVMVKKYGALYRQYC